MYLITHVCTAMLKIKHFLRLITSVLITLKDVNFVNLKFISYLVQIISRIYKKEFAHQKFVAQIKIYFYTRMYHKEINVIIII